jgi:hypothetical protein
MTASAAQRRLFLVFHIGFAEGFRIALAARLFF